MNCMLRIYAKDPDARCQFAHKFGCPKEKWLAILRTAQELNLNIMGISFHVGSGASSAKAYSLAIKEAREFYDLAKEFNYTIKLIDIGGGFTSHQLYDIPEAIQEALTLYFPTDLNCTFIAEPGRFFAETSGYLATNIIGIRKTETTRDYWITESLYGSFNCILYDHYQPAPEISDTKEQNYKTTLYGPTCDGLDKIIELDNFPEMKLNDWLIFQKMGAYTLAGACNFNGIPFLNADKIYMFNK
jgi:ornithine decarboxylase